MKTKIFLNKFIFLLAGVFFSIPASCDTLDIILNSTGHDSVKMLSVISLFRKYNSEGRYYKTIQYREKALSVFENSGDLKKESVINSVIGIAYYYKGNYAKAIEYYFRTLKLREKMKDEAGQGSLLNNIGVAYQEMNNFDLAKKYLFEGLAKRMQFGDSISTAKSLNNIGLLFYEMGSVDSLKYKREAMFDSSMYYFTFSLEMAKKLDMKADISYAFSNIGNVLNDRGRIKEALAHYQIGLKIGEEMQDQISIAVSNIQIGDLFSGINEYKKAISCYEKALKISEERGLSDNMKHCYKSMSQLYEKTGDYKKSLDFFKKLSDIKDTLFNAESNRQIAEMQTIFDTEKKDSEIKLLNKDKEVAVADKKKQKIILYSVIFGLFLVIIFSLIIYKNYKQKQAANTRLEKQNNEITHQKKEIEEQKEEIISSIRYAKRIQKAVLKAEQKVTQYLPDHFVLFKPKDIVSGDFYWAVEKKLPGGSSGIQPNTPDSQPAGIWYVAAADCTGHGVPGAFLTMLGSSYLNEIVASENLISPAEILNKLRDKVVKELSGSEGETKDGMDISLISFNLLTNEVKWAGANNSLYLVTNGGLKEIKADKQPVGYFHAAKPFTNHYFQLRKNDLFYIFTDGYADQFGGAKGKKFKYSQFEKLLLSISDKTMEEQKNILNNTIENWKGNLEQIDDICVIGVRI